MDTFRSVLEQEYEFFEYKGSYMATMQQNKATKYNIYRCMPSD